jgi:glycosyltransferase involved in cell wall biosynthesis
LYGGVESLLVTLARERQWCPKMEHSFALCFEGRLSQELTACDVSVHNVGAARFSRPWTVWRARRGLSRLLSDGAFEAVICHECWPHALFGPVVRRYALPLIFWAHGGHEGTHWVERWARRTRPDLVLVNSRWSQSHLPNLFPGCPSEVLHYPVSDRATADGKDMRRAVRAELNTAQEAVVIVQASRLERWKGHALLLKALARLTDVPGWESWLIGGAQRQEEEQYLTELRTLAGALGLGARVRFLGQRSDVPRLLAGADIHCQANTRPEPFGIAFVEALYAGLPVVTTALGGALEIVEETCGVLVPPGGVDPLAEALRRLLADDRERARRGAAGPARARGLCEPRAQIRRLEELLTLAVRGRRAA